MPKAAKPGIFPKCEQLRCNLNHDPFITWQLSNWSAEAYDYWRLELYNSA